MSYSEEILMRTFLTILFVIICIALSVIVLAQEGKSAGLGAISGAAETYWGKNKGRSMEGKLVMITRILAVAFMIFAVLLNLKRF
ncbi:MAG TPA: preprotein translocase subunit SecG [Lachnospiraceae bacterium]|nr:preprotein translocase subunit SecG [Lachnospiraceae bacterium]